MSRQCLKTHLHFVEILDIPLHGEDVPMSRSHLNALCIVVLVVYRLYQSIYRCWMRLQDNYLRYPFKKDANSCVIRVPFATNPQSLLTMSPVLSLSHLRLLRCKRSRLPLSWKQQ